MKNDFSSVYVATASCDVTTRRVRHLFLFHPHTRVRAHTNTTREHNKTKTKKKNRRQMFRKRSRRSVSLCVTQSVAVYRNYVLQSSDTYSNSKLCARARSRTHIRVRLDITYKCKRTRTVYIFVIIYTVAHKPLLVWNDMHTYMRVNYDPEMRVNFCAYVGGGTAVIRVMRAR